MDQRLQYQSGFGNYFSTEALAGTLPADQNSPQKVSRGLYAEQINGTAFTAPRKENFYTWMYRLRPSVVGGPIEPLAHQYLLSSPHKKTTPPTPPVPLRWLPLPIPQKDTDFIQGLVTMAGNGVCSESGNDIHFYVANCSMKNRFFVSNDGELLIVPQEGRLNLKTELGVLSVEPKEICVIPRGIKFQVELLDQKARGYICENYGSLFTLPDLGPIGANGLANPRHFFSPTANFYDEEESFELVHKFGGQLWRQSLSHNPLDVVAWHGNLTPYKYDLTKFNVINTVSFDHPDPSIFTVLTSQTTKAGTANVDFVIFPPRWMVAENTFRPPYYHRNMMSEFMGLIYGQYDAKNEGFLPGGSSLHNCMVPHGPDEEVFSKASCAPLKPEYLDKTLAFMFESSGLYQATDFALSSEIRDLDYSQCWQSLKKHFSN